MNMQNKLKIFIELSLISLLMYSIWLLQKINNLTTVLHFTVEEVIESVGRDYRYAEIYRKKERLPKDLKYILLWTDVDAPTSHFGHGQQAFIDFNCSIFNCYATQERQFFGQDSVTKFDAIIFNGRRTEQFKSDLPNERLPHQIYMYMTVESSNNFPACAEIYDNFFNRTATVRLDSDIPLLYIQVTDTLGNIVGPKKDMTWIHSEGYVPEHPFLYNKTKAAVIFISNCYSRSRRLKYVTLLQKELAVYDLQVDIFGNCGTLAHWVISKEVCAEKLQKDYFFYMALENSFSEDYVTEKVLTAFDNYAVPIVFGGVNYSRFLPPGSYIDMHDYSNSTEGLSSLASLMYNLTKSQKDYFKYFNWRNHYRFVKPKVDMDYPCNICAALNNDTFVRTTKVYNNFRKWWNRKYLEECRDYSFAFRPSASCQ